MAPTSSPYSDSTADTKSSCQERDASMRRRSRSAVSTSGIVSPAGIRTTKCTRAVVDSLMLTLNSIESGSIRPSAMTCDRIRTNFCRTLVL
jgi:hypothetical protein